ALPQIFLSDLMELSDDKEKDVAKHVQAAIQKLRRFQRPDGGFSYWPGGSNVHDWSTSYVGHFMLEAKKAGFVLPVGLLAKWVSYQKKTANSFSAKKMENNIYQAYRLYTLALAGEPQAGANNRLRESANLGNRARYRLAATLALSGQKDAARALIKGASVETASQRELSGSFASPLRDQAMALETVVALGDTAQADTLAKKVATALGEKKWLSTQESAYALMALSRYAKKQKVDKPLNVYAALGDTSETLSSDKALLLWDLPSKQLGKDAFKVVNKGQGPVYARLIYRALPVPGKAPALSQGLSMTVDYRSANGSKLDPSAIEQGEDFYVNITVRNPDTHRKLKELALSHLVPSGWEIHNERLDAKATSRSGFDYRDIRDDRVLTYFNLGARESKTFTIQLNASYLGTFFLPAIQVEAMYDASINARSASDLVQVKRSGVGL
ncbi:hypothetical protein KAI87_04625, partial [Myxococcota bacterium]|nr:hypothetical protein [Myxococcota bacterium]